MEASSPPSQRQTNFPSQAKLLAWLKRSSKQDLARVRALTLRLTDVDLSPLFDVSSCSTGRRDGNGNNSAYDLYVREAQRLDEALQLLSGLEELTIIPPSRNRSHLFAGLYRGFLGRIAIRLPHLRRLIIHDGEIILEEVRSLRKLAKVVFRKPTPGVSSPGRLEVKEKEKVGKALGKGKTRDVVVKMERHE